MNCVILSFKKQFFCAFCAIIFYQTYRVFLKLRFQRNNLKLFPPNTVMVNQQLLLNDAFSTHFQHFVIQRGFFRSNNNNQSYGKAKKKITCFISSLASES